MLEKRVYWVDIRLDLFWRLRFMLLGKNLSASKVHRRQLSSPPSLDVFKAYMRELLAAPPDAQFEIAWEDRHQPYCMSLRYLQDKNVAEWKLYSGEENVAILAIETRTNNVYTLFNLINSQAGHCDNEREKIESAPVARDDLNLVETRADSYAIQNLHRLLTEARDDISLLKPPPESKKGTLEFNQIRQPEDLLHWGPPTTDNKLSAQRRGGMPADGKVANISPSAAHAVDLSRGRGLLQSLLANELGIMSYPALLFLLEQEYYKALTSGAPMTIVILKVLGLAKRDGKCVQAHLPKEVVQNTMQGLKRRLRKTDLLAQYENDAFIFLLPETDMAGAKLFAKKVERFLSKPEILPGPGNAGLKVCFGVASLGSRLKTLPTLLAGAEQALVAALQSKQSLVTYDDYVKAMAAPWEDGAELTAQAPCKGINLDPMRQLMKQLRVEHLGIFTFSAWLLFLEREYNRAERQGRVLLTLLIRMRLNDIASEHPENMLPRAAIEEAFRRIESLQRKGDIVGQFEQGNYALLRPNASIKALENLSKQMKNSLTEKPLAAGYDHGCLRVGTQIDAVCSNSNNIDVLNFHPVGASH
jgi:GGDEF domain-containing protein